MNDGYQVASLQILSVDRLLKVLHKSAAVNTESSDCSTSPLPRFVIHSLLARAVATSRSRPIAWLLRIYPDLSLEAGELACNDQRLIGHNPRLSDVEIVQQFMTSQRLWDAPIEFPSFPRPLPVTCLIDIFLDCVTRWRHSLALRTLDLTWYESLPVERLNVLARRLLRMADEQELEEKNDAVEQDTSCFLVRVVVDWRSAALPIYGFKATASCLKLLQLQRQRRLRCQLHIVGYLNGSSLADCIQQEKWPLRMFQCTRKFEGVSTSRLVNTLELLVMSSERGDVVHSETSVGGWCVAPFANILQCGADNLASIGGDMTRCCAGVTSFRGSFDQLNLLATAGRLPKLRFLQLAAFSCEYSGSRAVRLSRYINCLCSPHMPQLIVLSINLVGCDLASCELILHALPGCRRLQVLECTLPRRSCDEMNRALTILTDSVRHCCDNLHTLVLRESDDLFLFGLDHHVINSDLGLTVRLC